MKNSYSSILVCTLLFYFLTMPISAQVVQKIGNNPGIVNENAVLELESNTKGFLLPRMNNEERNAIKEPTEGLMVWCLDCSPSRESEISIWMTKEWKGILINDLPATNMYLGNDDGKANAVAVTGAITMDSAGATSITPNAVTYPKIQNVNPNMILGRITALAGIVEEIPMTGTLKVAMSNSPTFTGIPLAPTAAINTNSDQIASTAFVLANTGGYNSISAGQELSTSSTTFVAVSGMNFTPGVGVYSLLFNGQFSSSSTGTTTRAVSDLNSAYQELLTSTTTVIHANTFGSGEILPAGVYATNGAGVIAGNLTLNGSANDVFIFKINGALTTSAGTIVNVTGGAQASNIFWIATSVGAMSIAASTQMVGNLFAKDAAATIGAGSALEGRLLSNSGAITTGPSTISIPLGNSVIDLGELNSYAVFTASGAIGNSGTSIITGNIGTNLGAVTGFGAPTVVNGTIFTFEADNGGAISSFSLYQNGVLIPNSTRSNANTNGQIILHAIANVTDGQAIDVRWKTSLGEVKLENRILTLIQVR